jgi:hypothetical protein
MAAAEGPARGRNIWLDSTATFHTLPPTPAAGAKRPNGLLKTASMKMQEAAAVASPAARTTADSPSAYVPSVSPPVWSAAGVCSHRRRCPGLKSPPCSY